ncbi:MAG: hypothetical protein QNJ27_02085 [Simkaniaceae bacterium]|nr:hypothetical protein [Simkaniaceae bacterium]
MLHYLGLYTCLMTAILTIPLDYYASFVKAHVYGFSNQSLGRWLNHHLIDTGVWTLIGIVIVWILYGVIRKSPRRWWLYLGILTFPLLTFSQLVEPIWIAPLFNKFGPIKNKHLEQKIL